MIKNPNIVFIGFLPGFGGAERAMTMIANGLAQQGYGVDIISLKDDNAVYEIDKKVSYIYIPDRGGNKIKKQIYRFIDLKNKLSEIKPDIVISFWLQPAIFTSILSKFIGFKTIYSERGDPTDKEYAGILGFLRKIFFNFIDGFVFQTEAARKSFAKSIQNRGTVINNPVYIKHDDYDIPQKRRKVIVNVGRLHEQKNQKILITAFATNQSLVQKYTLEIYGDGILNSDLEMQISKLGLENKVILKGTTQNLFNEIVDASLFVLSSEYEGMPNALMEAMALGIPCISTDYKPGGARELITHKINGLIVSRNSPEDLGQAIKYLVDNPKEAEKMGRSAKDICITNSVNVIIKKWEGYISKIINGNIKSGIQKGLY